MISGIYTRGEPVANERFRENTEKAAVMAGINTIPALTLCVRCEKRRTTRSGQFKKSGAFVCHGCGRV